MFFQGGWLPYPTAQALLSMWVTPIIQTVETCAWWRSLCVSLHNSWSLLLELLVHEQSHRLSLDQFELVQQWIGKRNWNWIGWSWCYGWSFGRLSCVSSYHVRRAWSRPYGLSLNTCALCTWPLESEVQGSGVVLVIVKLIHRIHHQASWSGVVLCCSFLCAMCTTKASVCSRITNHRVHRTLSNHVFYDTFSNHVFFDTFPTVFDGPSEVLLSLTVVQSHINNSKGENNGNGFNCCRWTPIVLVETLCSNSILAMSGFESGTGVKETKFQNQRGDGAPTLLSCDSGMTVIPWCFGVVWTDWWALRGANISLLLSTSAPWFSVVVGRTLLE